MKICAAQLKPVKGDIQTNITAHLKFIELALSLGADAIFFPELSLTGYEPTLAKDLATTEDDNRLNVFQQVSNNSQIIIGVGLPTINEKGICISMILFQPQQARIVYSKKYLHADEEPFFVSGENFAVLKTDKINIGIAICYELSIPEHSQNAHDNKADVYMASVAKTANGVEKAAETLSGIANKFSIPVLICNAVGPSDDFISAGKTSVWNNKGALIAQLNATDEGIIIFNTYTGETVEKMI